MKATLRPTLVIGMGGWGARVAAAFSRRVSVRAGPLSIVRAATLASGGTKISIEPLVTELDAIRRLDAVQEARRAGWGVDGRSGSVAILVASLGEDGAGEMACEAARQLRDLSGCEVAHLALGAVFLFPCDGRRIASDSVCLFDEGCCLLDQVNADGLLVTADEAQADLVACWLALRVLTPLQTALEQATPPCGSDNGHFDTFGLAVWEFPLELLTACLTRRWQRQAVERLLVASNDGQGAACAFLERCTPVGAPWTREAQARFRVTGDVWAWPSFHLVHTLRDSLDAAVEAEHARLTDLVVQAEEPLNVACRETGRALVAEVDSALDGPGLAVAERFLGVLEDAARLRAIQLEREAERSHDQVAELDKAAQGAGKALDELAERFPRFRLDTLAGLILRPWRLLRLWLLYRELSQRAGVYLAYRQRQWLLQVEVCERRWQAAFYAWLAQAIEEERAQIAQLHARLEGLRERLAADPALEQVLDQRLAASALPEGVADYFYRKGTGDGAASPAGLLALSGPLSRWAREDVDIETLGTLLAERAREEFDFLANVRLDELLVRTYSGAELRRRLTALVDAAAPWWVYDESVLEAEERAYLRRLVLVGLPDAESSLLVDLLPDRLAVCFSAGDPRQVVVTQVVQGLPLTMVEQAGEPADGAERR